MRRSPSRPGVLGIADRFKLLGFRRDVPDLMRAVDVMCLPSHREPFGLVYVEAGLAGKPVIACDAGGAPEVIVSGETGLLVPPPFPHALLGFTSVSPSKRFWFGGPTELSARRKTFQLWPKRFSRCSTIAARPRHGATRPRDWLWSAIAGRSTSHRLQELYDRVLARPIEISEASHPDSARHSSRSVTPFAELRRRLRLLRLPFLPHVA